MTTSNTFGQAEIFYNENKATLIEVMFSDFKGSIDRQDEYNQIAVDFDGFIICYQDSDMNGDDKGKAHWSNPGADAVFTDLGKILKNDKRFSKLYASDEVHDNYFIETFINDFCREFAKRNNIDEMLQSIID